MSGIAEVLLTLGYVVSGSDVVESETTRWGELLLRRRDGPGARRARPVHPWRARLRPGRALQRQRERGRPPAAGAQALRDLRHRARRRLAGARPPRRGARGRLRVVARRPT